jgi:hypothetical protein
MDDLPEKTKRTGPVPGSPAIEYNPVIFRPWLAKDLVSSGMPMNSYSIFHAKNIPRKQTDGISCLCVAEKK